MAEFFERAQPWAATLVSHNWPVMLYSLVALWAAWRAYRYPTRHAVLFLYGALTLVLAYEYQKHGLATVQDTTNYFFSLEVNRGLRVASQWVLIDALPVLLRLLGVGLLGFAMFARYRATRRGSRPGMRVVLEL